MARCVDALGYPACVLLPAAGTSLSYGLWPPSCTVQHMDLFRGSEYRVKREPWQWKCEVYGAPHMGITDIKKASH